MVPYFGSNPLIIERTNDHVDCELEPEERALPDGSKTRHYVYAKYDIDGDGVVSDVELSMSERLQKLEVMHEKADAQKNMPG